MLLKNKVGIVTGAASGMGRAASIRLVREGARLGLFDISEEGLAGTKAEIEAQFPDAEVICLKVDVSSEEEVKNAVEHVSGHFGKLNIAFNNAGILSGGGPIRDVDTAEWERSFRINFFGGLYCSKYEAQQMLKSGEPGSIVLNSSVGGLIGTAGGSAYSCAKAALITLAKSMACDLSADGIRTNAICPGQIDTPMYQGILTRRFGDDAEAKQRFLNLQNPQHRLGLAEEVAAVVAFLLSDEASHITGTALPIDGGHMATNAAYSV